MDSIRPFAPVPDVNEGSNSTAILTSPLVGKSSKMARNAKRSLLRLISEEGLRIVLKGIPRKHRRAFGRVYCTHAYRAICNLPPIGDRDSHLVNLDVLEWVINQYNKVLDAQ